MENIKNDFENIIKQKSSNTSNPFSIKKTYSAYIILIILLAISFVIYNITKNQIGNDLNNQYEKAVSSIINRFEVQYENKLNIVKSTSGLYQLVIEVVRDYFDLYSAVPVKTYPSILSINYIEKVYDKDLSIYKYFISTQGYYDYSVKLPTKKEIYYPIHHIMPYEINKHRHGFDISTQELFFKPAWKSVIENDIVATECYVSRSKDTLSFFLIAPIFVKDSKINTIEDRKNNLKGFLALELDAKKFFDEALIGFQEGKDLRQPTDSLVYFEIIDNTTYEGEKIVYKSLNYDNVPKDFTPYKSSVIDFPVADRKFTIKFYSIPNFATDLQKTLPIGVLAISLILSFVFFAFVISVTTSRARAVALADKMTESQRRIVEASRDIIGVFDINGIWLSLNPAVKGVFNKSEVELLKTSILDLNYENNELNDFIEKIKSLNSDLNERITIKMKYNQSFKWIMWNLNYVKNDNLVYVIGRDVTLEKLAEEEAALKAKQVKLAEMYALEASESKTYFMKKLSHQLRNSLTGIIGYLQLLNNKLYETEEEMNEYLEFAEQSSEEIFTFVSDIVDATIQKSVDTNLNLDVIYIGKKLVESLENFKSKNGNSNIKINIDDTALNTKAIADTAALESVYSNTFEALLPQNKVAEIQVEIQENPYDGVTEIQMLAPPNIEVKDLINLYNNHSSDIINYLQYDKGNFLFKISNIASIIRRLNGSFKIDYLGDNDGILVSLILPRNKQIE